ncbi:MAG: deoxyribose-phosphate aldolase [Acidobacteriota bacterium]
MDPRSIAALIDHTLLKPEATAEAIRRLCAEARQFYFAAVCVNPCWVRLSADELLESGVAVATVVGFPLGANQTATKVFETERAIEAGANEIDMVMNIGQLLGGDRRAAEEDMRAVVESAHARGAIVKVILETALLTDDQKRLACELACVAGTDFVKTSTGFGPGGAKVEDIRLMRATVGPGIGVKASGGVRTLEDCRAMMAAGANRIGTSAGVAILDSLTKQ